MVVENLLVFAALAVLTGVVVRPAYRPWLILVTSVLAVYWLQPASSIRHLDFWIPTATLAIVVLSWAVTLGKDSAQLLRGSTGTLALLGGLVLLVASGRYLHPVCCLTASVPPALGAALIAIASVGIAVCLLGVLAKRAGIAGIAILFILGVLLTLKAEPLGRAASAMLRLLAGQMPDLAQSTDLTFLGFSYIAFRLIHTILDRAAGRLPAVPLREYVCYATFFPALTAGPISRAQPFLQDLNQTGRLSLAAFVAGGQRILLGVFKKVVLADALALVALDPRRAAQTEGSLWAWVLLYAYSLRIFLDFSALTDIALGLARWMGIRLPENFDRPYTKTTLTAFWNSWHITLAQWVRAYVYNPLTRSLRSRAAIPPVGLIIFVGQLTTMLLIGIWHGVTVNFALWGAWHGLGLFISNRWNELRRSRGHTGPPSVWARAAGLVLTFHFVTLGWIWFALPNPTASLAFVRVLLGVTPR